MRQKVFRSKWERILGRCESPIESLFLSAFAEAAFDRGWDVARKPGPFAIGVEVQKRMDRIRVDFLITHLVHVVRLEIVVECDGHEFHERTKVQAERDRSRDRGLQAAGYTVFRFTGAEINRDARGCAVEVLDLIEEFQTETVFGEAERMAS